MEFIFWVSILVLLIYIIYLDQKYVDIKNDIDTIKKDILYLDNSINNIKKELKMPIYYFDYVEKLDYIEKNKD